MKRLFVWVRSPEATIRLAGELATTDPAPGGRFDAEFEYSRDWVSHPDAFTLDPVSVPLQPLGRRYRSEQFYPPLSVFEDALPDDWGRAILTRALKSEGRKPSPAEMLLRMQGAGLSFQYGFGCPTVEQLLAVASAWDVARPQEIIEQVTHAVAQFETAARELEVQAGRGLESVKTDVRRRLELIGPVK